MIRNYFKIALRNLWKNKVYGFLNIFGLSIGIACAALIFLWVENELTFDQFQKKDYLFQVMNNQTYDGVTSTFGATPGPLAAGIKAEIPGIKNTARSTWGDKVLFSLGDKAIYEQGNYVDSAFFSMLNLSFIKGKTRGAFSQLHSVVITQEMAQKFFGDKDPVGKSMKVDDEQEYTVTGVIENLPENSSFQFSWLSPFKIYEDKNAWLQNWGSNGIATYVEIEPNANVVKINEKLKGYIVTKNKGAISGPFIFPMKNWRLYSKFENGKQAGGRIKYVKLFTAIAWIILFIACINFMNLATARSEKRAKEVGVRKVVGAAKGSLISQFIYEALLMSFLAVFFAVLIIYLSLPGFNMLVEKQLSLDLTKPSHFGSLLGIGLIAGLIAGSYPAFYLSSFSPVAVLKGLKIKTASSAGLIRKGLVITQFSISIMLIISTVIIYQQIQYVKSRDLGYNKQGLIYMNLQGKMADHFSVIRNELISSGYVQNAALSSNAGLQIGSNGGGFSWSGKDPNKEILIIINQISPEYISTIGMQLKEGRDFYSNAAIDSNNVIINESLAKLMGKAGKAGSIISYGTNQTFTVAGVVKDFLYNDMYSSSEPLIFFCTRDHASYLNIRFKNPDGDRSKAISKVESIIKANNPGYPVEYKFLDQEFDKLFKSEMLVGKLSTVFAVLAILISCLGLFGLAAYTAERRVKEIGIRKTLGASTAGLAKLLSTDFLKLVIISCFVAFPLSWWAMHNWLNDFAYRTTIQWWVFVAAGMGAILIAILTVSFQAVKAALSNPVKSLRTE